MCFEPDNGKYIESSSVTTLKFTVCFSSVLQMCFEKKLSKEVQGFDGFKGDYINLKKIHYQKVLVC
jgi:hypothetical protein